ncbi:MAG: restriction endonuclease subunit S [Methylomonas sp.]|nr:restriction endonuclease subunit S [Methylomonas sp.]
MDNEVMRDSGVEWITNIPREWIVKRIGDISLKVGSGITPKGGSTIYLESGIPLLRSQNIHFSGLKIDDVVFISEETHQEMKGSQVKTNDVLLNITGASLGRCYYLSTNCIYKELNVNQHVCIIRPNHQILTNFLYYFLYSDIGQSQIFSSFRGASREGLNFKDIKLFKLGLPTVSEQQVIAEYLDQRCAKLDAIIAIKRQQIQTLDAFQRNVISETVTRGFQACELKETGSDWMPEIPGHWKLVNLKRVSKIQTGFTLGKQYDEQVIERPYLRVANVQDGHLSLSDVTTIEVPEYVASRVELRAGDVLMTEGGDLDKLGRGTVWNAEIPNCLHQNHIFAVRCLQHKLLPGFLAYLTTSRYGRDYFEVTGKRTTNLASTNSTKVGQFPIPLPPLNEQKEICDYLEKKLSVIAKISAGIEAQISTLEAYKKSLIYECVTGKKRVVSSDTAANNRLA